MSEQQENKRHREAQELFRDGYIDIKYWKQMLRKRKVELLGELSKHHQTLETARKRLRELNLIRKGIRPVFQNEKSRLTDRK